MTTFHLKAKQCSQLKFPVGCPIWYNFPPPPSKNAIAEAAASSPPTSFVLKRGVIQGALLRGNQLFYEVDTNGRSVVEEVEDGTFGFGASCPVTILPNVAADADADSLGLEGEIVLCTPSTTDRNAFVYTAMVFLDGASNFRYEGGIEEKRVVYRRKVDEDERIAEKKNSRNAAAGVKSDDANAPSCQQRQSVAITTKNSAKVSARHCGGSREEYKIIEEMPKEAASARNHFTRKGGGSYEEGQVIETMPMEASSARNHVVPSSITTTTTRTTTTSANVPGGADVSLSATDSFGSTNTKNNESTAESSSQSRTKKPRICLSEYNISKSMNANSHNIKIAVPLWLQKDCQSQRNLFFHLLGSSGCNKKRIEYNTRCKVYIDVILGEKGDPTIKGPMTIHVDAMNTSTALADLATARQMIQSLLLQFVGNDGSRGRLLYEAAQSCLGPHRPNESTSNAVKDINPFHPSVDRIGGQESFMSVVELPCNFFRGGHTSYLLSKEILCKIKAANAHIRVVATEFKIPTKLCDPYLFLVGKSYQSVDRAVAIVLEVIRGRSQGDNGHNDCIWAH